MLAFRSLFSVISMFFPSNHTLTSTAPRGLAVGTLAQMDRGIGSTGSDPPGGILRSYLHLRYAFSLGLKFLTPIPPPLGQRVYERPLALNPRAGSRGLSSFTALFPCSPLS